MDSRWIGPILAAGWLLLTLGIWGACGEPWWIWPLAAGLAFLVLGAAYLWALWRTASDGPLALNEGREIIGSGEGS